MRTTTMVVEAPRAEPFSMSAKSSKAGASSRAHCTCRLGMQPRGSAPLLEIANFRGVLRWTVEVRGEHRRIRQGDVEALGEFAPFL